MNIGIICYASIGGSGIVATELGSLSAALRRSGERESAERARLETP